MPGIDFKDIAKLLNFSRTTNIDLAPIAEKDLKWSIHRGSHNIHTSSYPFHVLYIKSAATLDDIKGGLREISKYPDRHIVFPESMEKRAAKSPDIERMLQSEKHVFNAKEYLVSFITEELHTYLGKVTEQSPRDYIDPFVEVPAGFSRKIPNPVLSFLLDPPTENLASLGIVLAEAGQGKTYMSRHLVSRISTSDRGLVPLMVDSSQWQSMTMDDQRSLAKTIAHSFRHFGSAIGWLDGHEEEFLDATLKADVFRIVFDGFDEYILRNRGLVQPIEVLDALAGLAAKTGTRIVITSRTSFWNTNIPQPELEAFLDRSKSYLFKLLPFDLEHAKKYFDHRLPANQAAEAVKIYGDLRQKHSSFMGRGFVLSLISDLASESNRDVSRLGTNQPLKWLTESLCQREVLRQKLPLTSEDQMSILRMFAMEVAEGGAGNTELLDLCISIVRPTLDSSSHITTIEKLKSHPLIERDCTQANTWTFKQEQVRVLLLADQILNWPSERIATFVVKARLDPGLWQDLGTMLVDMLLKEFPSDVAQEKITSLIRSMCSGGTPGAEYVPTIDDGSRLAGIVALTTIDRVLPRGTARDERAAMLLSICGGSSIRNIAFLGTVASFDFRGFDFEHCRFERVGWANCKFDENTSFNACQFFGGVVAAHSEGLGRVSTPDCRFDPDAEAILNSERIREGCKKYCSEDLRSDIRFVIQRFIIKGGLGLRPVEASTLTRGAISASRYRDEIIAALSSYVLEERHISGAGFAIHVRSDAAEAVKFYAANNVFVGPLREAFDRLIEKLHLE
jgi:NACHT domain